MIESVRSSCARLLLLPSGGSQRCAYPFKTSPPPGSSEAVAPWARGGPRLGGFAPKPPGFIALRARAARCPDTILRSVGKGCPRPQGDKSQGVWGTGPPDAAATARGPQELRTLSNDRGRMRQTEIRLLLSFCRQSSCRPASGFPYHFAVNHFAEAPPLLFSGQ